MNRLGLGALVTLLIGVVAGVAIGANIKPVGAPVLNQALQGVAQTKSDTTVFVATRGIHVGDGTACDVTVRFQGDNASTFVALQNLQPGSDHPYSIVQLRAATTCTAITLLY